MRFHLLLCSFLLLLTSFPTAQAQVHRYPDNGGDGVPGALPNSFLIGWDLFDEAVAYEYVVSDNPLCFVGCSGDTRNWVVRDTLAVEYNMEPNKWYYWITRIYLANGDTAHWSPISSFFTESPEDLPKVLTVANNPTVGDELKLMIDWARNPDATDMQVRMYDQNGYNLKNVEYRRGLTALRFQEVNIPISDVPSGFYVLDVLVGNNQNNRNNFFTIKVMVLRD